MDFNNYNLYQKSFKVILLNNYIDNFDDNAEYEANYKP